MTVPQDESPLVDIDLTTLYGAAPVDAHTERLRDFVEHVVRSGPKTAASASWGGGIPLPSRP